MEFPIFDGTDPSGWTYRAEQFFLHQQTPLTQRLLIASYHLEGKALQWFRWMERSNAIASWDDFSKGFMTRFGQSLYDDAVGTLTKLRQTSSVEDYQTRFEELVNRTSGLNGAFMISCFLGGLNEDIRFSVCILQPTTLFDAVGWLTSKNRKLMQGSASHGLK